MMGLTPAEAATLDVIQSLIVDGIAPSYREIGAARGVHISTIHRFIKQLKNKGRLRHIPGAARAIEIVPERRPISAYSTEALIAELHIRGIEA